MAGLLSVRFPLSSLLLAWPAQTALRTGHRAPGSRQRIREAPAEQALPDTGSRGRHLLGAAAHFLSPEDGCDLGTQDAAPRQAVRRLLPAAGRARRCIGEGGGWWRGRGSSWIISLAF